MSSVRIPLAFYTAVRGYSWRCTNATFSNSDFAAIEKRVLSCSADGPVACVFTYGDWVFFTRYLKAENYDYNMRSADYYVVGAVRKYDARNVDFKKVFESEFFARPINRESALVGKFPPYLDYEGGSATNGKQPLGNDLGQQGSENLSSIGNWIGNEVGNVIVNIANDIANPFLDVKIEGGRRAREGSIERNALSESEGFGGTNLGVREQSEGQKKHEEKVGRGDSAKDSKSFFAKSLNRLRSMFGLRSPDENVYAMGSKEIHDYSNLGTMQSDKQCRKCVCPICNGTGKIDADLLSDLLSRVKGFTNER